MRASRNELPEVLGARATDWGDLRSIVLSLPAGTDLAPLLKGLPNDLCSCPHWGYVFKGRMRVSSFLVQNPAGAPVGVGLSGLTRVALGMGEADLDYAARRM